MNFPLIQWYNLGEIDLHNAWDTIIDYCNKTIFLEGHKNSLDATNSRGELSLPANEIDCVSLVVIVMLEPFRMQHALLPCIRLLIPLCLYYEFWATELHIYIY